MSKKVKSCKHKWTRERVVGHPTRVNRGTWMVEFWCSGCGSFKEVYKISIHGLHYISKTKFVRPERMKNA